MPKCDKCGLKILEGVSDGKRLYCHDCLVGKETKMVKNEKLCMTIIVIGFVILSACIGVLLWKI